MSEPQAIPCLCPCGAKVGNALDKYEQLLIRACKGKCKIRRLRRIWQIRTAYPQSLDDVRYDHWIGRQLATILEKNTAFPGRLRDPETHPYTQWFSAVTEAEHNPDMYCDPQAPFFTRLMMVLASRIRFVEFVAC
jgi:hypothetical protein